MGRVTFTIVDFDGETASCSFPTSDLTSANIDTEYADSLTLQSALGDVQRGLLVRRAHAAKSVPLAVGRATDAEAQREEKALVRMYDSVTFERMTLEIPCVDMGLQITGHPGYFYLSSIPSEDNSTEWLALVDEIENMVVGPGGNSVVVEDAYHVGRNT